jgi:hypothetical protein
METVPDGRGPQYGLGLMKAGAPTGDAMWGHGGDIVGYRAEMWSVPDRGVTLVTLWNDATISVDLIGQSLLDVLVEHGALSGRDS